MRTEWDGELYEQQRRVFGETLGSWTCVAYCRACTLNAAGPSHASRNSGGAAPPLEILCNSTS
jgi:hypothetical protein